MCANTCVLVPGLTAVSLGSRLMAVSLCPKLTIVSFGPRLMAVEDELRGSGMPEIKPRMFADQVCPSVHLSPCLSLSSSRCV